MPPMEEACRCWGLAIYIPRCEPWKVWVLTNQWQQENPVLDDGCWLLQVGYGWLCYLLFVWSCCKPEAWTSTCSSTDRDEMFCIGKVPNEARVLLALDKYPKSVRFLSEMTSRSLVGHWPVRWLAMNFHLCTILSHQRVIKLVSFRVVTWSTLPWPYSTIKGDHHMLMSHQQESSGR